MKVTMLHQISGTRNGQEWPARGEQIDLPTDEAEGLIASGMAVVAEDAAPEKSEKRPAAKRAEKR